MIEGGLDASFFIVYVGQGPLDPSRATTTRTSRPIAKFDAIHRLTEEIAPDKIGLALTAADARRIYASGRKVAFIGVENGYPIGEDLGRRQGVLRPRRPLHVARPQRTQPAGRLEHRRARRLEVERPVAARPQAIAEMNRLGMMIDVSHPSKGTMMQTLQLTKAPIIASHSAVRKLSDNSRNMDDEQLLALKKNGGVIQIVAFDALREDRLAAADAALDALRGVRPLEGVAGARGCGMPRPAGTPLGRAGGRARRRGGGGRGPLAIASASPEQRAALTRTNAQLRRRESTRSSRRRRAQRSRTSSTTSTTP